jgi:hypothetical protein
MFVFRCAWPGSAAFCVRRMKILAELVERRRELHRDLNSLIERRGAAKSDSERLQLIPEVVAVMREIREIEEQLARGN